MNWFPFVFVVALTACIRADGGVSPADFSGSDSLRIEQAIVRACETGNRSVVVTRNAVRPDGKWLVDRAILLPDDFTLTIEGTCIQLASGVCDNIIRNEGAVPGGFHTSSNIVVRGIGRAELCGGRTDGILFRAVDGFSVENLTIRGMQSCGVSVEHGSCRGRITNLRFADTGRTPSMCGVDIRKGSHDIFVRDIVDTTVCVGDAYNIIVDGVVAHGGAGVRVKGPLADSALENILTPDRQTPAIDVSAQLDRVRTDRPPLETRGIQNAIDAAAKAGGGRVTVSEGIHRCGTLRLRSNVELHLEKGAVLLGGERPEDYDDAVPAEMVYDYDGAVPATATRKVFVVADGATNVAITGEGTIDARGPEFFDRNSVQWRYYWAKPKHFRPRMVVFNRCRGVRFEGVTFKDSPTWTMWLRRCEDISVSHVRIECEQRMINSDGIDFDGCRNVRVGHSFFRTGDDALVLRAIRGPNGEPSVTEDVVVSNCVLESACQGVRVGCPSDDTIRNALFRDIVFRGRNAIGSEQVRTYLERGCNGRLATENVRFENWTADCWGRAFDVFVDPGVRLPRFGGLTFSNIIVRAEQVSVVRGTEMSPIRGLRFIDVRGSVAAEKAFEVESAPDVVFENCNVKTQ